MSKLLIYLFVNQARSGKTHLHADTRYLQEIWMMYNAVDSNTKAQKTSVEESIVEVTVSFKIPENLSNE